MGGQRGRWHWHGGDGDLMMMSLSLVVGGESKSSCRLDGFFFNPMEGRPEVF